MFGLSKCLVCVAFLFVMLHNTDSAACDSAISISRNCGTGGCDVITFQQNDFKQAIDTVSEVLSKAFESRCQICSERGNMSAVPRDCMDIQQLGYRNTGVYIIYPIRSTPVQVRCDMDTDSGGWTVIQRRVSDTVFSKAWQEYKDGFGDLNGNFWLGNDIINTLTTRESMSLRIDMNVFNESSSVTYSNFSVENEAAKYRLTVSGYSGLAGDSLVTHNGMMFTTKDHDNDANELNCADRYHGGWWYHGGCVHSNLNGEFGNNKAAEGILWYTWKGHFQSLTMSEMKIRRT